MEADIRWLDCPDVFRVNQCEAHSDHYFYENRTDYENRKQNLKQSLNGMWKFHYSRNAKERPADFYKEDFDKFKEGLDEVIKYITDNCFGGTIPVRETPETEQGSEQEGYF